MPMDQPRTRASKSSLLTRSLMNTDHSSRSVRTSMPICFQASWAMARMDLRMSLPLLVIRVNWSRWPSFRQAALGVGLPAGLGQKPPGGVRVVRDRGDRVVVEIRLSQKRPRRALALVVENEADDLVHVDRHGERAAHPRVVERRAAQVVADVGSSCRRCPRSFGSAGRSASRATW